MLIAVTVGSVAKGITGAGLPLIAVPVMATFLGVQRAVVIMALPTFVTNCWLIWEHRRHFPETQRLLLMLALGLVGTILGTIALATVDPAFPAIVLALVVFAYLALRWLRGAFTLSPRVAAASAPFVGAAGGVMQGATGVSGPVIVTYFHGLGLSQGAFLLSITTMFQGFAIVQIATFAVLGLYTAENLIGSLAALVPIVVMFPVGIWLGRRLHAGQFERIIAALLVVMGSKLLFDGVTGLS